MNLHLLLITSHTNSHCTRDIISNTPAVNTTRGFFACILLDDHELHNVCQYIIRQIDFAIVFCYNTATFLLLTSACKQA